MIRFRRLIHRILRAVRSLIESFRTEGPGRDRGATPTRRAPWPRCIACHRHVASLCEKCRVCPACCDPREHEDDEESTAAR